MKKLNQLIISLLLVCFLFQKNASSQYELVRPINNELRNMFSQISFPDTRVEFLYERSANMIDSSLYQHNNFNDTLHATEWYLLYEEMYFASHDTLQQKPVKEIKDEIQQYQNDTVNFGVIFWNSYNLKPVSLQSGNYFIFDTANNKIFDHPSPISTPYILDSLFLAAPLSSEATFKNVTYRINPNYIFRDAITSYELKEDYTLQIDFGDGVGFRTIDPTTENYIAVSYTSSGEKIITTRLVSISGVRSSTYNSVSRIYIVRDAIKPIADFTITDIPGMTVGVYNSCQLLKESKKVIFVEGYDFADFIPKGNRTHQDLYDNFIQGENIHHLQNFGYEYYVIDWHDSKQDMRFNSYNLLLLIEKLKKQQADNRNDQEFVIIGESMGGVIGRYVINYMESSHYQNDNYQEIFFVEQYDNDSYFRLLLKPGYQTEWQNYNNNKQRRHNTRLLITLDSPHQGANMPLAYQHLYRLAERAVMPNWLFKSIPTFKFQLLDRKASRQLLKNWAPPIGLIPWAYSVTSYSNEYSHNTFFQQSKFENGGNPRFCKMVALSDGALDGSPQQDPATLASRVNGDYLLDLDYNMDIKVLWIKLNLFSIDVRFRTTPHQSLGQIFKASYGKNIYLPKFKLFGITIDRIHLPLIAFNKYAINTDSYDNVAGGLIYLDKIRGTISNIANKPILSINAEIWGGFLGFYGNATVASNGMSFCFVPLESALDYNSQDPSTNTDILNTSIDDKLSLTPFDVFTGNVIKDGIKNKWHVSVRNPNVYNLTQTDAQNSFGGTSIFAYHTCAEQFNHIPVRTFLSQEIGDEVMYLENFYTDRITSYRPEWDIHVNNRNPYYTYSSQPPSITPNILPHVFSKENDFNVVNSGVGNGYVTFFYDNNSSSPTPGLNINYINSTSFTSADVPYGVCCATSRSSGASSKLIDKKGDEPEMTVYPNPCLNTDILLVKANFPDGGHEINVSVYDITGKTIYTLKAQTIENTHNFEQPLNVSKLNLKNGIYIIKVENDSHSITEKIIIQ